MDHLSRHIPAIKEVIRTSFNSLPKDLSLRVTAFSDNQLTYFALAMLTTAFHRTHIGSGDHTALLDGIARSALQTLVRDSSQPIDFAVAANEYRAAYSDYARHLQNVFVADTQAQAMQFLSRSFLSRIANVRFDSPQANYLLVIFTSRILTILLEETLTLVDDSA